MVTAVGKGHVQILDQVKGNWISFKSSRNALRTNDVKAKVSNTL